jgi:hypothetical protein
MAQTSYTPILIYSSSTTTNAPAVGNLTNSTLGSELAINITDGKLFYKDNANAIQVIGWKTVPATAGGTGQTSYAVGDILYASSTTALSKLADVATGNALISGGVNTAPFWGKIGLTTHVSGTLAVGNGGTGIATLTANHVPYGNGTSAFQSSANLQFNGTNLAVGGSFITTVSSGIAINNATAGSFPGIEIQTAGVTRFYINATNGASYLTSVGTNPMVFYTNSADVGRWDSSGNLKLEIGNLVIGTSGKGIDFSATPGTGTSELLADYEEGTWTPTDGSGVGLSFTNTTNNCFYTKVGNLVTCVFSLVYPSTASAFAAVIAGLPFTSKNTGNSTFGGYTTYTDSSLNINYLVAGNGTTAPLYLNTGSTVTNVQLSTRSLRGIIIYTV